MERQEEPAVRQEPARQQVAERETEQAPMPQRLSEFRAEERAPQPQNATPDLFAPQSVAPSSYAPHREPQRELPIRDEQQSSRGFLQRALDVGRAFSAKPQDAVERVQVVQRGGVAEAAQRKPEQSQEEQYLDIPAFLRRQAN